MAICFFSAFLLRMHAEQIRSRKFLAALMFTWGIIYFVMLLSILTDQGDSVPHSRGVASPFSILMGNFAVIVTTFYVVEVVRPGWLTWMRVLLWFVPFIIITLGYFAGLAATGEEISCLPDMKAMNHHIREFNVWYRYILLFVCFGYLGAIFFVLLHYSAGYRQWVANHYSNDEKMNISWVWFYGLGLLCMTVNFFISILTAGRYMYLSHLVIITVFFSYINYKGLFHINPYPEGYFRKTMDDEGAEKVCEATEKVCEATDSSFTKRIEECKFVFEEWMRKEKPYLRPDFKLTDVAEVLPMNRSYLSRLFNEGYGMSFSQLVRQYRIEEAKQLMKEQPEIAKKQLAIRCGFASQEVFSRAFAKETGKTTSKVTHQN